MHLDTKTIYTLEQL